MDWIPTSPSASKGQVPPSGSQESSFALGSAQGNITKPTTLSNVRAASASSNQAAAAGQQISSTPGPESTLATIKRGMVGGEYPGGARAMMAAFRDSQQTAARVQKRPAPETETPPSISLATGLPVQGPVGAILKPRPMRCIAWYDT